LPNKSGSHAAKQQLCDFESTLLNVFEKEVYCVFEHGTARVGLEQQGLAGEIALTLLAQEMRDFCLLEFLDEVTLAKFAQFFLASSENAGASRTRIGPLSRSVSAKLNALLQSHSSNFAFFDAVLAVEPLIKRGVDFSVARSLDRALRNTVSAGLQITSEWVSVPELTRLHVDRWGLNRSALFFQALIALARAPYCNSISIKDSDRVLGHQIDFCFAGERRFYYSVAAHQTLPGIGTALLAESIRRFAFDPEQSTYSFGRGGEKYKFRYANCVRFCHYVVGFRVNGREEI
jgi:hypothetical protein